MRVRGLLVGLLGVVCAVLVLGVGSASALTAFPSLGRLSGPAPGQSFGRLNSGSVAVNDFNGHVFVADSQVGRVYDFASAGDTAPVVWDGSGTPAGSFGVDRVSVAVDDASGDVYVADTTHLVVNKFDASGALIESFGDSSPAHDGQLAGVETPEGSFSHPGRFTPLGIAVDQATHDLYVIDSGHKVVDVFDSEGVYLPAKQITATPIGLYGCEGEYTDGIAVNAATGHVFVSDSCAVQTFEFDALGNEVKTWDGSAAANPGTPAGSFGVGFTSVAVNDSTGDVYITDTTNRVVDQFNAAGEYLAQIPGTPGGEFSGVAVDQATGEVYVSDNAGAPLVGVYGGAAVTLPDVATLPASNARPASATLHGTVNPDGVPVSNCRSSASPRRPMTRRRSTPIPPGRARRAWRASARARAKYRCTPTSRVCSRKRPTTYGSWPPTRTAPIAAKTPCSKRRCLRRSMVRPRRT